MKEDIGFQKLIKPSPKPLWKFLSDGGVYVCIDYGYIESIMCNANCASWATGDVLAYRFFRATKIGLYNNRYHNARNTEMQCDEHYMKTEFTKDMIASGLKFLGIGDKIPSPEPGYYIAAAFHQTWDNNHLDFHFIRMHKDGIWTERPCANMHIQELLNDNIKTVYDFVPELAGYTIFKGWYAVPECGIQTGLDAALYKIKNELDFNKMSADVRDDVKDLIKFYAAKNKILNNVTSLEQLEKDFARLLYNAPALQQRTEQELLNLLAKHTVDIYPQITHSPWRDLQILKSSTR